MPAEEVEEAGLRPRTLAEFVGQPQLVEHLGIVLQAARRRRQPVDHLLFAGPPGLGKTSLAGIVAAEMGVGFRVTSGPVLARAGDLAALLTDLQEGDVLFIDEIHRLAPLGRRSPLPGHGGRQARHRDRQGPHRSVDPPRPAPLHPGRGHDPHRPGGRAAAGPLRVRGPPRPLRPRRPAGIVERSARILGVTVDAEGAARIAERSRGTPRIANRLLRRVRDFVEVRGDGAITGPTAAEGLALFGVDELGLDKVDRAILDALCRRFGGQPVGLTTLSQCVGEEPDTIEDAYEPFLLQQGLIQRTPRGRVATPAGLRASGRRPPGPDESPLF